MTQQRRNSISEVTLLHIKIFLNEITRSWLASNQICFATSKCAHQKIYILYNKLDKRECIWKNSKKIKRNITYFNNYSIFKIQTPTLPNQLMTLILLSFLQIKNLFATFPNQSFLIKASCICIFFCIRVDYQRETSILND